MAHLTWQDYREEVKKNAIESLDLALDYEDGELVAEGGFEGIDANDRVLYVDNMVDDLLRDERVTGNVTEGEAAENVATVVHTKAFNEAWPSWDMTDTELFEAGAQAVDTAIRCHMVFEVANEVADTIAKKYGLEVI